MGELSRNFAEAKTRADFAAALRAAHSELGREYPLVIGGQEQRTGEWTESIDPAHPSRLIGRVAAARPEDVEHAAQIASQAQAHWAATPAGLRIDCLRRAADLLRQRRDWFAALEVYEVGKSWREADADVVETIDYFEYYARQMQELAVGKPLEQRPGERNEYRYAPRGVAVVIAPWNFPLAILMGMTSAALVTGNAVIMKPAEPSAVIGFHAAQLLYEAGVPHDALHYLPGKGEVIGPRLTAHPLVQQVLFTGSRAVGLSLLEQCSRVAPGQRFVRHAVVEMGGKNALIIDADADLDAAVGGIMTSAFGYQGQKCSAASRLIVHETIAEALLARLEAAMEDLRVGDPALPDCDLGPLINAEAQRRVLAAIEEAQAAGQVRYRYPAKRLLAEGFYCPPTLCERVEPSSRLAQDELFGPVLCVFRFRQFSDALALANDSDYALTGGVYSRSPAHLEQAAAQFDVGNLYMNRPITGAIVGRQPFGGHKLSGLGTKAGGPDYLLQLVTPKVICENTTRHGMPLE